MLSFIYADVAVLVEGRGVYSGISDESGQRTGIAYAGVRHPYGVAHRTKSF